MGTLLSRYSGDLQRERGMTESDAAAEALRQMKVVLPEGFDSDKMILRSACVDSNVVGWVWASLPGAPGRPEMAWLHNIEVDPDYRSNGYGRAILLAIEEELSQLRVTRLGLNVFGQNKRAIRLYESLGYRVMSQQMAKRI
ncbi:GNAT family N-acetyltransferase [Krasilnikovia cinnamomea]|uniref:GNAT family N-acetyltransferase n=1 Tax=Krasilnikovia cinnamomea TaxID=349313 RepID=UPI0013EF5933|nr:GNAT family N-acetyltransferase [Krasilnikovia cinnamomea]